MCLLPGRPTESLLTRLRRDRHDPAGQTSQIHRNPRTTPGAQAAALETTISTREGGLAGPGDSLKTNVERYPPIEPFAHGLLDVGDGNRIYWEACGNPDGKTALVVHGGPGSGSGTGSRRYFAPQCYRIVLFDQRGCGRSTPHASDPATDMSVNTTEHLLADMELLREHLGIEQWLLYGGSWGSTLILAYAERHPEHVSEIILLGATTSRRSELEWLYRGVGRFFPEQWQRFRALADSDDILPAYARMMEDPDTRVRATATTEWLAWEDAVISLEPNGRPNAYSDKLPGGQVAFVRICAHYFSHGAWLEEGVLLREAHRLAGIPGVIIHGRLDLGWPGSSLAPGQTRNSALSATQDTPAATLCEPRHSLPPSSSKRASACRASPPTPPAGSPGGRPRGQGRRHGCWCVPGGNGSGSSRSGSSLATSCLVSSMS